MPSLLMDISGDPNARKLTVERYVESIPGAAVSCGFNALGGFLAGRLDQAFMAWKPSNPAVPTIGVGIFAVALKAGFQKLTPLDNVIREVAAGMAGWVGDDVFYGVWNALFRKDWQAAKSYRLGQQVKHQNAVFEASADILYDPTKGHPQAVPGKDARWKKVDPATGRAQGFRLSDLREAAQAFVADPRRVDAIADDAATLLSERGHFTAESDKEAFKKDAKQVLNDVIAQFKEL